MAGKTTVTSDREGTETVWWEKLKRGKHLPLGHTPTLRCSSGSFGSSLPCYEHLSCWGVNLLPLTDLQKCQHIAMLQKSEYLRICGWQLANRAGRNLGMGKSLQCPSSAGAASPKGTVLVLAQGTQPASLCEVWLPNHSIKHSWKVSSSVKIGTWAVKKNQFSTVLKQKVCCRGLIAAFSARHWTKPYYRWCLLDLAVSVWRMLPLSPISWKLPWLDLARQDADSARPPARSRSDVLSDPATLCWPTAHRGCSARFADSRRQALMCSVSPQNAAER